MVLSGHPIGQTTCVASTPAVLGLHFLLELMALFAVVYWGWTMQDGTQQIRRAIHGLEERTRGLGQALSAHAWKTFVASAVASLAVIGVAVYMVVQAHRVNVRAEWIDQVNAAIADGKLARCAEGGVCARAGNKWVRLDQ